MTGGPRGTPPLDLRAVEALSGEAKGVATLAVKLADRGQPFVWDRLNPKTIAELLERLAASEDVLLAHCRALRAVLEPLADYRAQTNEPPELDTPVSLPFLWRDVVRAAAVLAKAVDT